MCTFWDGDFDKECLLAKLATMRQLFISTTSEAPSVADIREVLCALSAAQKTLMDEVAPFFKLLLVLPDSNANSERSFSALRRIKSYLRSTMTQARLNHRLVFHYHQEKTDSFDMRFMFDDYVYQDDARRSTFAKF